MQYSIIKDCKANMKKMKPYNQIIQESCKLNCSHGALPLKHSRILSNLFSNYGDFSS